MNCFFPEHRAQQVGVGPGFFLSLCCNEHSEDFFIPWMLVGSSPGFVTFLSHTRMSLLLWRDLINVRPPVNTR